MQSRFFHFTFHVVAMIHILITNQNHKEKYKSFWEWGLLSILFDLEDSLKLTVSVFWINPAFLKFNSCHNGLQTEFNRLWNVIVMQEYFKDEL